MRISRLVAWLLCCIPFWLAIAIYFMPAVEWASQFGPKDAPGLGMFFLLVSAAILIPVWFWRLIVNRPAKYPNSTSWIKQALEQAFGEKLTPAEYPEEEWNDDLRLASHLYWMCQQVIEMEDASKASRWIGWVYACMQFRLNLMSNQQARDLARSDKDLL